MYELIPVTEHTYYINTPSRMGVYRVSDEDVWLIDSGNDKDAGRKVQKLLDAKGWKLTAVLNTHSHADHTGGNALLQNRLGCAVYASPMECAVIEHPVLEPSLLYGGFPFKQLRNKFLMAAPSHAEPFSEAVLPAGMEVFPLGGHCLDMVGIKTPDDVYFLADCVFGEDTLQKYHISFQYDIAAALKTLDFIEGLSGRLFVPAHAAPAEDIRPLAELNRRKILEVIGLLKELLETPLSFDVLLKKVFDRYGLKMDHGQYVLVGSTIRSYLSFLSDAGEIESMICEHTLFWQKTSENTL